MDNLVEALEIKSRRKNKDILEAFSNYVLRKITEKTKPDSVSQKWT